MRDQTSPLLNPRIIPVHLLWSLSPPLSCSLGGSSASPAVSLGPSTSSLGSSETRKAQSVTQAWKAEQKNRQLPTRRATAKAVHKCWVPGMNSTQCSSTHLLNGQVRNCQELREEDKIKNTAYFNHLELLRFPKVSCSVTWLSAQ